MLGFVKRWLGISKPPSVMEKVEVPKEDISIEEVRRAAASFAKEKPEGVHFSVLINDDNEIDYKFLVPYLKAIPIKNYYISRETYEIFEDKVFAQTIDRIQRAVDQYIDTEEKFPIVDGNPEMKVSYMKLKSYLRETPPFDTYLTADENLITWRKPLIQ
ncbi:DUF3939 domain-containing protein [Ammoniphilus sp. YIM 78166]|uniref:DUF3939 domain-containing protein n=1 Tax=Ammoniphilus sp. YIM 78166 TaxID=1644106 RepID=UPI00142F62DB|nr:DUF3939 domain-containing protein [Ammoniphilus sp. YIM 78166]